MLTPLRETGGERSMAGWVWAGTCTPAAKYCVGFPGFPVGDVPAVRAAKRPFVKTPPSGHLSADICDRSLCFYMFWQGPW